MHLAGVCNVLSQEGEWQMMCQVGGQPIWWSRDGLWNHTAWVLAPAL